MVHSKLVLYLLVTRAILHCQSESLETKVDRLSDRLNLLDSKVSLDLVALRQDLEEVWQLVATSDKGGENQVTEISHVTDDTSTIRSDIADIQEAVKSCYSSEHAIQKAFKEEKKRRKALEAKLEDLQTEVFEEIKSKITDLLENRQQTALSFSARAFKIDDLKPWETVIFPDVVSNRGGAYNGTSGSFVASISGTYVFYCNILSNENSFIELALQVNGKSKLLIYSSGTDFHGTGSNMLVAELNEGDNVKVVKYGPWGTRPFYVHNTWSTFSGFLLFRA